MIWPTATIALKLHGFKLICLELNVFFKKPVITDIIINNVSQ